MTNVIKIEDVLKKVEEKGVRHLTNGEWKVYHKHLDSVNSNFLRYVDDFTWTDDHVCNMLNKDHSLINTKKMNREYFAGLGDRDRAYACKKFAAAGKIEFAYIEPEVYPALPVEKVKSESGQMKSVYSYYGFDEFNELYVVKGTREELAERFGVVETQIRKSFSTGSVIYGDDQGVYVPAK